jgi:hypothetical protein
MTINWNILACDEKYRKLKPEVISNEEKGDCRETDD